jgi:ribonuclease BN (tRNA processing enzyme)
VLALGVAAHVEEGLSNVSVLSETMRSSRTYHSSLSGALLALEENGVGATAHLAHDVRVGELYMTHLSARVRNDRSQDQTNKQKASTRNDAM